MKKLLWAIPIAPALLILTLPASGNPLWPGFFQLEDRPYSLDIPPAGSTWRAIVSEGGIFEDDIVVVQDIFEDNGDGVVSAGDDVYGPDQGGGRDRIVIDFPSPGYWLENGWVLKPIAVNAGGPVCETWEILLPRTLFGTTHHVDDWILNPGPPPDQVVLDGVPYAVMDVRLVVEGVHGVPVRPSTWGRIKAWLQGIF